MDANSWEEEQQRLREAFTSGGVVGDNLSGIDRNEETCEEWFCGEFRGYRLVHQSYLSFLAATIRRGEASLNKTASHRGSLVLHMSTNFSRARAAEIACLHGYPLEGFALLRDLKDRALYLAAVHRGISSMERVFGVDAIASGNHLEAMREMASRRRKEHRRIHSVLLGEEGGLPQNVRDDLAKWERLFHDEVHMSMHSLALNGEQWTRSGRLPLGAALALEAYTLYMNRSLEVAWCLFRMLPMLQAAPHSFGADWADQWRLLDANLRRGVMSLTTVGVEWVASIGQLVEAIFDLDPSDCWRSE